MYVVMPEENGKVGQVTVEHDGKTIELQGAYSGAKISKFGDADTLNIDQSGVQQNFSQALSAQPVRPVSFMLYFIEGTDKWTAESDKLLPGILDEIAHRPAPDIDVIGHTDTVGSVKDNDALSLKRAQKFLNALSRYGIPQDHVTISGRGERELLVPTADSVDEPRNRRAEINVR